LNVFSSSPQRELSDAAENIYRTVSMKEEKVRVRACSVERAKFNSESSRPKSQTETESGQPSCLTKTKVNYVGGTTAVGEDE